MPVYISCAFERDVVMFQRDHFIRSIPGNLMTAWLPIPAAGAADPVPSLPGAVTKAPDRLGFGVPFDVKAFFAAPPPA
jgi:hypothetical protein